MWSDYLPDDWQKSFSDKTGIKLNYTGIGSNEEIINKMKATKGKGIDICSPTNNRSGQWVDLELLQPWDYGKISNIGEANPAMLKVGDTEWNFASKGSHWLPHIWGTEGIGWRTDLFQPKGGVPSYGDVWDPANAGKTMMRAHSGMLGAGLHMEASGQMDEGSVWAAYESEEKMKKTWDQILAFVTKNKQTAGEAVTYQAPKEGAMAWVDGMSLSASAANSEQAYEFVKFCFEKDPAGKAIDKHGYNSAVLGADGFSGAAYKKNFAEAYPGDALANLNPWPAEPQWYADMRLEYENKFKAV